MNDDEELVVIEDDEPVEKEVKKKTRTKKESKVAEEVGQTSFKMKLFNLAEDVGVFAKEFTMDGYNSGQSYQYVKASQYKTILRKAVAKNNLIMKIDDAVCDPKDILKGDKMILTQYHGVLTLMDIDSDEKMTYMIWAQGADTLDKGARRSIRPA